MIRHVPMPSPYPYTTLFRSEAVHPFTTSIGGDVRLTTRYDEHDLRYALFSTIHEAGHGLYEQGLDPQARGTPRGQSCSLRSEEHTSELQSLRHLVCRLLLEK